MRKFRVEQRYHPGLPKVHGIMAPLTPARDA
ncbi:hypothetical protein PITC_009420 [Penicillium italicum]|uniref:Uncharacterized protein n=1 Tax=Penicillium italicum TaxID=40296 RepID=A0A0A2KKS0_PENIT|nr:hypothetical protein PITC_009420 [Penicillium italicum]